MRGDRITYAGLVVVGAAAAVMSFAALAGLAALAGVAGHVGPLRLPWLLPVSVDAYAATATGVWLRAGVSLKTRNWARANALAAIGASVAGNAIYHELTAGPSARTWVVVIVAAVPPLMLGAAVHTAVLVSADRHPGETLPAAVPVVSAPVLPASPATDTTGTGPVVSPGPDREQRDRPVPACSTASGLGPAEREQPLPESVRHLELVAAKPTAAATVRSGRGGEAERVMRAHWTQERAAGRHPSGAELDRVAGTKDYGRRVRRQLINEEEQIAAAASALEEARR
jgi:hypothetical protein